MGSPTELPVPGRGSVTRRCFRSWPLKSGDLRALVCSQGGHFRTLEIVLFCDKGLKLLNFTVSDAKMGFLSRLNQVAALCIGSSGCLKWFDASAWKNYPRKSADLSKQRPSKIPCKQQVKSFTARAMQLSTPLTTSPVKLANAVAPVTVTAAVHSGQSSCRHAGGVAVALAAGTSAGVVPRHPRNTGTVTCEVMSADSLTFLFTKNS